MALSAEEYLALDLFWFFFGSSQKRTKRSSRCTTLGVTELCYGEQRVGNCGEPTQINAVSFRDLGTERPGPWDDALRLRGVEKACVMLALAAPGLCAAYITHAWRVG